MIGMALNNDQPGEFRAALQEPDLATLDAWRIVLGDWERRRA
ncbi:hypothetical protein X729_23295 [Mesorhizobium sp. L103C131B0]|nr:hypothetical protein X729_23295 [Mesorhizobium sp. L103C131B0]